MIRPGFLGKGGPVQAPKSFWSTSHSDPPFSYPPSMSNVDKQNSDSDSSYG